MSEIEFATKLANKVLNDSSRDPDSDLSTLARQFLRSLERENRLRDMLQTAYHALRSYQYENSSAELAKSIADSIAPMLPPPPNPQETEG